MRCCFGSKAVPRWQNLPWKQETDFGPLAKDVLPTFDCCVILHCHMPLTSCNTHHKMSLLTKIEFLATLSLIFVVIVIQFTISFDIFIIMQNLQLPILSIWEIFQSSHSSGFLWTDTLYTIYLARGKSSVSSMNVENIICKGNESPVESDTIIDHIAMHCLIQDNLPMCGSAAMFSPSTIPLRQHIYSKAS